MLLSGFTVKKIRLLSSVGMAYLLTIGFVYYTLQPPQTPDTVAIPVTISQPPNKALPEKPRPTLISGKPVRIAIADSSIDLPVDEGFYNENNGSWTLSQSRAQFAMMSFLSNNISGSTFIYGHATDQVFGRLVSQPPSPGSTALVYTDNGHVFSYTFASVRELQPNDTSVFSYKGPPILTVQTCTGALSEWRSMFQFNFDKVVS